MWDGIGDTKKLESERPVPPATAWAAGIVGLPTIALARALDSLDIFGVVNPPRLGRNCGVDSILSLICTSPHVLTFAEKAVEIARGLIGPGGALSAEDVDGFVANVQTLSGAITPALMPATAATPAIDSPPYHHQPFELRALELDTAAMDADQLASLRRVMRAVAANALRAHVIGGAAQHADVKDAGGDGREWRVAVADGLLKALNMKALLLTEHCSSLDGTVTRSTIGSPGGTEVGALLLRPAGGEHAGSAFHFHAVLCENAKTLAKAIKKARQFVDQHNGRRLRNRDKAAADMEKELLKQADSNAAEVRANALEALLSVNEFHLREKERWVRGGGGDSKPAGLSDVTVIMESAASNERKQADQRAADDTAKAARQRPKSNALGQLLSLDKQLIEVLKRGDIRLLRMKWLHAQPPGYRMQRRQVLEQRERQGEEPLLSGDEAVELFQNGKREVGALSCALQHGPNQMLLA